MDKKLIIFGEKNILMDEEMEWFKDVLVILRKERAVREIDREYQKRARFRSWPEGVKMIAELYKGYSRKYLEKVAFKYCKEVFRSEVRKVLIGLKRKGYLIGVITANPQFINEALLKIFPLNFIEGSWFEFQERKSTGNVKRIVDRYLKPNILRSKREAFGLKKEQVILISDSASAIDFPTLKEAGVYIGFDSKKESLKEVVEATIKQKI